MNPAVYSQVQLAVFTTLAITLAPVLLSKKKVLQQRWLTWLSLALIYSAAIMLDKLAMSAGAIEHSASGILWILVGAVLQRETLNLASDHEKRSLGFLLLFTILNWMMCLSMWLLHWHGFVLFFVVAAFDVASWLGGQFASRAQVDILAKKLAPKTSPNKTWAGLIFGATAVAIFLFTLGRFEFWQWLVIIGLAATGDWLESKFKRTVGVKDAANWLPGFGGLLDRLDSILLLAPVVLVTGLLN